MTIVIINEWCIVYSDLCMTESLSLSVTAMEIDWTESSTEFDDDEIDQIFREHSFYTKSPSYPELNPDEGAMGRASQEDSGVCLAGPACDLQNSSYAQTSNQPDWGLFCYSQDPPPSSYSSYAQSSYQPVCGLFCYSQDPPPSSFYNPDFEEYMDIQHRIISPTRQMESPDDPENTPDNTRSIENPDGVLSHGDIRIPQMDTAVCGDYYRWEPGSQYLTYMGVINREVNSGDGSVNAPATIHASHDTPMRQTIAF